MAEEYSYPSGLEAAAAKHGNFLKAALVVVIVLLAGEIVWVLGIGPFRPFSRIDINGAENTAKEVILAAVGFGAGLTFASADVGAIEKALAGIVSIESARVFKHFPGTLQITVQERQAVASAFVNLDGEAVPVLIDSQGVVFRIGGAEKSEYLSVPVVSGLEINAPYLGVRLPARYVSLLEDIEKLKISKPNLLKMISEIKINQKYFDSFDLILYPINKKIRVRLSDLNEERLQYNLLLIDLLPDNNGIGIIDSRSGIASYIPKEASPD